MSGNMEGPGLPSQHINTLYAADHKPSLHQAVSSPDSPISFENQIEDEKQLHRLQQATAGQHVLFPALTVCLPMMLLCAALLAVVLGYEIRPRSNIFGSSLTPTEYKKANYLLVDFSDTKIVFLASFLSTVAPLLAGCVMTMASVTLLRRYYDNNEGRDGSSTTKGQDLLMSSLLTASYRQLLPSSKYFFLGPRHPRQRATIIYAAALLLLTIMMSLAVTVADAALHMLTETVSFTTYSQAATMTATHGRGLNALCANFDRVKRNYGFPCTTQKSIEYVNLDLQNQQSESQRLLRNKSDTMEMRYWTDPVKGGIAYLLPKSTTIDDHLDYQASTIGVSAKCSIIPASRCNLTRWGPNRQVYTSFNCSPSFWGTLGLAENVTSVNSQRQPSMYLPLLSNKPQSNLQYGFYTDRDLINVSNPAGLNDSGIPDPPKYIPVSDNDLSSTVFMAYAWRSNFATFSGTDKNQMITSNMTGVYTNIYYLDYFLNCEIGAYNVNYTWAEGQTQTLSADPISNGTILNMWQGTVATGPVMNGGGLTYQDINTQAALAGQTIATFENKFGELLSQLVLGTVGGFTSSRTVSQQQTRQDMLLAKVPKAALGALIGSSLLYPILGLLLLYKAHRSLRKDARPKYTTRPKVNVRSPPVTETYYQYHNEIPVDLPTALPVQSHSRTRTYDDRTSTTKGNRNSTAGLRFALWGNAGVGPSFNHLRPNSFNGGLRTNI